MKLSSQSRSFARQVQVDLLALSDTDLFHTIQQWVEESKSSELPLNILEESCLALGYTRVLAESRVLPHFLYATETESTESELWLAPSPHELRALITAMDVNLFAQHVISFAFHSLHKTYPEWYEGMIFNAHLANYLRQMKK